MIFRDLPALILCVSIDSPRLVLEPWMLPEGSPAFLHGENANRSLAAFVTRMAGYGWTNL